MKTKEEFITWLEETANIKNKYYQELIYSNAEFFFAQEQVKNLTIPDVIDTVCEYCNANLKIHIATKCPKCKTVQLGKEQTGL